MNLVGIDLGREIRRYTYVLAAIWIACICVLFAWNYRGLKRESMQILTSRARANFNKDQAFRLWATSHGGVYVPPTDITPPNPYLSHLKDRDVVTTGGKRLTLMNPAYMLRQIMDDYDHLFGVRGHITSLRPLNPDNAPDPWEEKALRAFEAGADEVVEVSMLDGEKYLRLIRPMIAQEGCLKCHGQQGYGAGDVRGGVSVSVPMGEVLAYERQQIITLALTMAALMLAGVLGIAYAGGQVLRNLLLSQSARRAVVTSEERLMSFMDSASSYFYLLDASLNVVEINRPALDDLARLRPELGQKKNVIGMSYFDLYPFFRGRGLQDRYKQVMITGRPISFIDTHMDEKIGERHLGVKVFRVIEGVGMIISDVTDRYRAEQQVARSLKEKEVLLEEVHHRVKNNMAIMISLLKLQAAGSDDPKFSEMLEESRSRIYSMALVHEKLYRSEDFASIDLEDYTISLVRSIADTYATLRPGVAVDIQVENVPMNIDSLVPYGLIINELVSNSYKHAFAGDGPHGIAVHFHRLGKGAARCELRVSDNGRGLPEGAETGRGLGLQIIHSLVRQLQGELTISREGGTAFVITFEPREMS